MTKKRAVIFIYLYLYLNKSHLIAGMLVTLKLLKRQDLVSTISRMFKPASDQIVSRSYEPL